MSSLLRRIIQNLVVITCGRRSYRCGKTLPESRATRKCQAVYLLVCSEISCILKLMCGKKEKDSVRRRRFFYFPFITKGASTAVVCSYKRRSVRDGFACSLNAKHRSVTYVAVQSFPICVEGKFENSAGLILRFLYCAS